MGQSNSKPAWSCCSGGLVCDLSRKQLEDIPEQVLLERATIRQLNLSFNYKIRLLGVLGKFNNVKKLKLKGCFLRSIPDEISQLTQLEELDMGGNSFHEGLNPAIGRLQRLKTLRLWGCDLNSIPDSLGCLEELEELELSGNRFHEGLNPAIGRLQRLKTLRLSDCSLNSVPDSLGCLEELEELEMCGNRFHEGLNPAICRLQRLKTLRLDDCYLNSIPDSLGCLEELEELELGFNYFRDGLNPAIGLLRRLKTLRLSCCDLPFVPEWFRSLEELRTLDLSGNRLKEYPACTLVLKKLEDLDLSRSPSFLSGTGLEYFNVRRILNRPLKQLMGFKVPLIEELPIELAFTNLRSLKFRGHPITVPPQAIWEQGIEAIKAYMKAMISGRGILCTDTINLLGDTGAGKSSVARSLVAGAPDPTTEADRTRVMQQHQMKFEEVSCHTVIVNDFGGHDVYHSVINIFLPGNGLLLLVFDLTKDVESIKKWLLTAISKSPEIRIILVGTHTDELNSVSQRSTLETRTKNFGMKVIQEFTEEVRSHISDMESRKTDINIQKLLKLRQLLSNLQKATIPVVTLSCAKFDSGLRSLRDLIIEKMQRPQVFPALWCRVVREIFTCNCTGLYLEMSQVQVIAKTYLSGKEHDTELTHILHYLSRMSLIIWAEKHPRLRNFIFHLPQKMIDTCKKVLHHEDPQNFSERYKREWEAYEQGIVSERLLRHLLSTHANSSERNQEHFDVAASFLEQFNLISTFGENSHGRIYVIPSKLTSDEPPEVKEFELTAMNCQHRVAVRLSFLGSMVPVPFFETCLSAMLTCARQWISATTRCWKSGIVVLYNGVHFLAKLSEGCLTLTAFCGHSVAHLWNVLQPVTRCLKEHADMWHGAKPKCSIECPLCFRHRQSADRNSTAGEIEIDLTQLAELERLGKVSVLRCTACSQWINRNLILPPASSGTAEESGATLATSATSRTLSEWDHMNHERLREKFRKNSCHLEGQLTREEVVKASRALSSRDMLLTSEQEEVCMAFKTPTEAARTLIGYVEKKDTKAMYCAFLEILQDQLRRHDLVKVLIS